MHVCFCCVRFSFQYQEIGWEQRLRNDLFCVGWDAINRVTFTVSKVSQNRYFDRRSSGLLYCNCHGDGTHVPPASSRSKYSLPRTLGGRRDIKDVADIYLLTLKRRCIIADLHRYRRTTPVVIQRSTPLVQGTMYGNLIWIWHHGASSELKIFLIRDLGEIFVQLAALGVSC